MIRDKYNIVPMFFSGVLHAGFIACILFVFDLSSDVIAAPPYVEAVLVSAEDVDFNAPPLQLPEADESEQPLIEEQQPPEPEPPEPDPPEPDPPEPEPPEPEPVVDNSELLRQQAEEKMRQEEAAREEQRLREIAEAEEKRKREEEAARKKREAEEAAAQKKREDEELERKRVEAERQRQEDLERQRQENERARQEALQAEKDAQQAREIAEEEARMAARNSGAMAAYAFAIQQKIRRFWVEPPSARPGIECVVSVRQAPDGDVQSASVGRCNGDDAVRRSIEAAVFKAAPLPLPKDPNLFERDLNITFKPEE